MVNRRDFLSHLAMGTAALSALPASVAAQTTAARYRPPHRIGQGGSPLGNASSIAIDNAQAHAVLENAWNSGIRYYDTSPFYGFGLSEQRFGYFLSEKPRDDYVLSTKIGRVFSPVATPPKSGWANPLPFKYVYDYSAEGTRRSIEDSLKRLGVSRIDIVFVHDISPDTGDMGERWSEYLDQAINGAMPELTRLREEGVIKAWGIGVNTLPPIVRTLRESDPDIILSACNYTLIDHEEALNTVFPEVARRGASVVVGSPLNNGFLAGGNRFNYAGDRKPQPHHLEKRARLTAVAQAHGVDLRTAALQFCAAPEVVSSVIPGARQPAHPAENAASFQTRIPADFWAELKQQKLIAANAPVPA